MQVQNSHGLEESKQNVIALPTMTVQETCVQPPYKSSICKKSRYVCVRYHVPIRPDPPTLSPFTENGSHEDADYASPIHDIPLNY